MQELGVNLLSILVLDLLLHAFCIKYAPECYFLLFSDKKLKKNLGRG